MSTGPYPVPFVQSIPIFAAGKSESYLLTNIGSTVLYVSEQTNVTTTYGYPMAPNSTKVWPLGTPLYALSTSAVGNLHVGVLGDVTNPTAVGTSTAASLLTSGLAELIAQSIALEGVPTIDAPVVLASSASINPLAISQTLDVSRYQSVTMSFTWGTSAAATPSVVSVFPRFFANGALGTEIQNPWFLTANGWTARVTLPVVGDTLVLSVFDYSGTAVAGGDFMSYTIVGSYRPVDQPRYSFDPGVRGAALPYTGFAAFPTTLDLNTLQISTNVALSSNLEYAIPHNAGDAVLTSAIALGAIVGTANFALAMLSAVGGLTYVHNMRHVVLNDTRVDNLILPPAPLKLVLRNATNTAAATYFAQLNSRWQR